MLGMGVGILALFNAHVTMLYQLPLLIIMGAEFRKGRGGPEQTKPNLLVTSFWRQGRTRRRMEREEKLAAAKRKVSGENTRW